VKSISAALGITTFDASVVPFGRRTSTNEALIVFPVTPSPRFWPDVPEKVTRAFSPARVVVTVVEEPPIAIDATGSSDRVNVTEPVAD
jgi:hypothetical protein